MIDKIEMDEAIESARSSGLSERVGLYEARPRALHDRNKVVAILTTFLEALPDGHTIQEVLESLRGVDVHGRET